MKNIIIIIIVFVVLFFYFVCEKQVFGLEYMNDFLGNFDVLWEEYNEFYGLFCLKGIDWVVMCVIYCFCLSENSMDVELYEVLVEMLDEFDDGYVGLIFVGMNFLSYFGGVFGSLDIMVDFDLDLLIDNYLSDFREMDFVMCYDFVVDSIGYVYIENFVDGEWVFDKEIDQVLDYF